MVDKRMDVGDAETGFRLARVGRDMSKNLISSWRTLISPVF